MYEVGFYRDRNDRCPGIEFLQQLQVPVRAKVAKWIELLEKEGPNLPRPYADVVKGKIRELRVHFGQHFRLLYFFMGKRIIITHGFVKKTDEVPEAEITRAQRCMEDFLQREGGW
jgi:phage-related protein